MDAPSEVETLTRSIELVAAGSWAVDLALRRLDDGQPERARAVLEQAHGAVREGMLGLRSVLDSRVQDSYERPERLARALESLQALRDLAPSRAEATDGDPKLPA